MGVRVRESAARVAPGLRGLVGEVLSNERQVEIYFASLGTETRGGETRGTETRGAIRKLNRNDVEQVAPALKKQPSAPGRNSQATFGCRTLTDAIVRDEEQLSIDASQHLIDVIVRDEQL